MQLLKYHTHTLTVLIWSRTIQYNNNCTYKLRLSRGYRIHQLLLCRGVTPPPNDCPRYDNKQSDGEVPVMLEFWGMQSNPSLPLLLGPLLPRVAATDRVLCRGQIELNYVLMLKWIAWNRTILTFKPHTHAKLNCFKYNWFGMLNSIVWNRTGFQNWNCTYAVLNS